MLALELGGGMREYVGCRLISPLEIGEKYFVNFKVSLIDRFIYCANNKIGALFSTVSYNLGADSCNLVQGLIPNNFAHVYSEQIITDTSNWTTISGSFIADSSYQYIIIGNHFDDTNTDTICFGISNPYTHYLIDDIYVSTDSILGINENSIKESIAIYPTVTSDEIFIQSDIPLMVRVRVFDVYGRLIIDTMISLKNQSEISLSEYNSGIYIINISSSEKSIIKKIILTK